MAHNSKTAINKFLKLIQAEHQKYFLLEDESLKEEHYRPLRKSIKQYLELVLNDSRFTCDIFANLFKYNFEKKPDFNAADAQQAFDNLEKYASNLMSYPWRKEFQSIKLYCGFFKHQVARHLLKPDTVLRLMGYNLSSNSPSCLTLDEPPDPDKLIMVSLNCIIASCECEIIHEIYTAVKSGKYMCTYKEIYNIRKTISNPRAIAQVFCSKDRLENSASLVSKYSLKNENGVVGGMHHSDKNERNVRAEVKVGQLIDISPITTSTPEIKKKLIFPDDLYEDESSQSKDYLSHRSSQTNNSFQHKKNEKDNSAYANVVSSQRKEKSPVEESENLKFGTQDDHIKSSIAAVHEYRKQGSEEPPATRDASWGYVDKTLQSRGLNRSSYPNRNDVLEEVGTAKTDREELEMLRRKSRENEQQLRQLQQQQLSSFHANPMMSATNSSEYMQFPNYLPSMQHMPPTMLPGYSYMNHPYLYNPEIIRNPSFSRNVQDIPPDMQQWVHTQNRCLAGGYFPPTPSTTIDGSIPLPNNFVSAMQTMNLIDNSRVENGVRSQETNTPISDPSEENRRSVYDNVQPERDVRDPYSNYLPGMYSSMVYMPRPHPIPPMAGLPTRPVEPNDFYGTESREKLHRKDSHSLTDEQVETDGTQRSRHQIGKTRNKVDGTDPHYFSSDKEKNSPVQRRLRSETPSVHSSSKRTSQSSIESEASNWECKHCTFLNSGEKKICDICGRSKTVGPESRPLQCGGHECPKCTLINDSSAAICVACGTNLANSPTYL